MASNSEILNELPPQLSLLLKTLLVNSNISSWNIYQNISNNTCVTIRFDDSNDINISPQKYRRVSDRQVSRNFERAQKYKSKLNSENDHISGDQTEHPSSISTKINDKQSIITRSKSRVIVEDIEQCREASSTLESSPAVSVDSCYTNPDLTPRILKHSPCSDLSLTSPWSPASTVGSKLPNMDSQVQVGHGFLHSADSYTQVEISRNDQSMQAVPQLYSRKIQTGIDLTPRTSRSIQTRVITKAGSIQVGSGSVELVDSSSQVTPDPVVSTEDKSSEVTEDLVDTSHKHSQTQFLVPGHENNPEYDPYWLNKHCYSSACRYGRGDARLHRGAHFRCSLCNIVMCLQCKSETAHDDMCTEQLLFHRV